ncbi:hypothetical protein DFH28DRAFT_1173732 [Melampsora americana]|nr:hypothetical protein DFH28DRAFT_1173732 [Melampsora americana]
MNTLSSMDSQPPCPDCGREFPLRPKTNPNCGRCQWREAHNGTSCESPYCHLCGVVYKYLEGIHCSACSRTPLALSSNTSQVVPSSSLPAFKPPEPLIPNTANPNELPAHLFVSDPVTSPALSFPGHVQHLSSSKSTDFSSRQAEELARILTTKNRTNWPKPPIKKAVLQPKPSKTAPAPKREGKIKMTLLYLKGTRKTQHPLDPKMCKLGSGFVTKLENSAPPPDNRSKLYPLPEWDDRYCQVVDNGCSIDKDELRIKIEAALKKPSGLTTLQSIGVSFSCYKYSLTIPKSPLLEPLQPLLESDEDKPALTRQATTSQKAKRSRDSSSSNESLDVEQREVVKQKKKQKVEPTVAIPTQRIKVKLGPPPKSVQSDVMVINKPYAASSSLTEEGIEEIDQLASSVHHVNKSNHHNNELDDTIHSDHDKIQSDNHANESDHGLESAQSQYPAKGIEQYTQTDPQDAASKSPTSLPLD